jgi:hypothetical protein
MNRKMIGEAIYIRIMIENKKVACSRSTTERAIYGNSGFASPTLGQHHLP